MASTRRSTVAAVLAIAGVAVVGVGYRPFGEPAPSVTTLTAPEPPAHPARRTDLGVSDGAVPNRVTVFDDEYAAVRNLDGALAAALRRAATDARVAFYVDSGWRSASYQQKLLDDAIVKYGSRAKALRWVASPNTSAHVSGDAVDMGAAAAAWLAKHGSRYGLCQIYRNEPWHYELRRDAVIHGCPRMYADPTQDPRMRA